MARNGSPTPAAAREHAAELQDAGGTVLVQPYDPRVEHGETALVFLGGEQSHAFTKGPILPPAGRRPVFDASGTYAEESLTPAEPDFELWDVGHAALAAAAAHLGISATDLLYARVDVIGGRTIRNCWNWNWWSRRWAGVSSTTPRGTAAAPVRARRGVSPRAAGPGSALASTPIARRSRPCSGRARDVDRHQRGGHAREVLHACRRRACARTSASSTTSRLQHRPRRAHRAQPEDQADQQ